MANALTLDARPAVLDSFATILHDCGLGCSLMSSDSVERGIRRKDTASYQVTDGAARVEIDLERRLGNQTMFISVVPAQRSLFRSDDSSDRLAKRIVELLLANGAEDCPNTYD